MQNLPRTLLILAAVLALIAGVYILLFTTELREIERDHGGNIIIVQPWYESVWGVAIVIAYFAIYYSPYHFYSRNHLDLSILFALAALLFTLLGVNLIGAYYLPASGVLLLALLAMGINLPRTLLILSALLALAASLIILNSTTLAREWIIYEGGGYEKVYRQSWYESQGLWGIALPIIFVALYTAPYYFFRKERVRLSAIFAIIAIVLTYLACFSIGGYYLPAVGVLLLSFIVLGINRLRQR